MNSLTVQLYGRGDGWALGWKRKEDRKTNFELEFELTLLWKVFVLRSEKKQSASSLVVIKRSVIDEERTVEHPLVEDPTTLAQVDFDILVLGNLLCIIMHKPKWDQPSQLSSVFCFALAAGCYSSTARKEENQQLFLTHSNLRKQQTTNEIHSCWSKTCQLSSPLFCVSCPSTTSNMFPWHYCNLVLIFFGHWVQKSW